MGIRRMNLSDLNQVVRLYRDANLFAKVKDIRYWTKDGLVRYPDLNFIYEQDGEIIGAISAVFTKKDAEINDIAVLKKSRNRNIGSKLLGKLIHVLTKEDVKKISLWVHWSNAAAIPFYYKFGFTIKKYLKTKNI